MIRFEDCIKIGKLGKAHGTQGAFKISLEDAFFEEDDSPELLFVLFEGYLVPFFIEELVLTDGKNGTIKFDHIHKPEDTREFVNCDIYASNKQLNLTTLSESNSELTGYTIIDKRFGMIGKVDEVQEDSMNPLILTEYLNDTIYIPYNHSIVLSIDRETETIITDMPDGLLELNN